MRCPKCKSIEDRVIDSRPVNHYSGIRRRRVCLNCEYRFTTYEQIERADMLVIKRDGRHEPFDRHKLSSSIGKACEKRPVNLEAVDAMVEEIVQGLETQFGREVASRDIGAKIMEKLHALDEVAYVRYASIYRRFRDVGEFLEEIKLLETKPKADANQPSLF